MLTPDSVKMYKTKIREWQLQKNYKTNEKQAILDFLKKLDPSAVNDIHIEIRGRPAKINRIFRYSRARGIVRAEDGEDIRPSDTSDLPSIRAPDVESRVKRPVLRQQYLHGIHGTTRGDIIRSMSTSGPPLLCLAAAQYLQDAEEILLEYSHYYRSYLNLEGRTANAIYIRTQPFFGQSLLTLIVHQYSRACQEAARANYKWARILLGRVHRQLHLAITAEHIQLLGMIFMILNSRSSNSNFETAELFGRFAADLSCTVLGEKHPVTQAIQRYCRMSVQKTTSAESTTAEFMCRFRQMRLKTARALFGDTNCLTIDPRIAQYQRLSSCPPCSHEYFGLYSFHHQCCRHKKAYILSVELPAFLNTPTNICTDLSAPIGNIRNGAWDRSSVHVVELQYFALHDCADFQQQCMDYVCAAERRLHEELGMDPWMSSGAKGNHMRLRTLKGLIMIAECRSRWSESEILCREALIIGTEELGKDHYYTRTIAECLMDLMSRQGRNEEAERFAVSFGLEFETVL
jgi:hypothetical protein